MLHVRLKEGQRASHERPQLGTGAGQLNVLTKEVVEGVLVPHLLILRQCLVPRLERQRGAVSSGNQKHLKGKGGILASGALCKGAFAWLQPHGLAAGVVMWHPHGISTPGSATPSLQGVAVGSSAVPWHVIDTREPSRPFHSLHPTFASFPAPVLKSMMPMLAADAESGQISSPSSPVVFLCSRTLLHLSHGEQQV